MRPKRLFEEIWQKISLPAGKASVIFKAPNKQVEKRLLEEI